MSSVSRAQTPVISGATSSTGTVGLPFAYDVTASNTPTSFNATGLPAGLTIDSYTGVVWGTPTIAGTATITLSATNSSGTGTATLTVTTSAQPLYPVITSGAVAAARVAVPFNFYISASNSPSSYGATGLPAGLTFDTINGVISGNPTTVGTSTVTLTATNSLGTGTSTLLLTVTNEMAKGADVGWLQQMDATGFQFYDTTGTQLDPEQTTNCLKILKERNVNLIRLRVFVPPQPSDWNDIVNGNCNVREVVGVAQKAAALGIRVSIDLECDWSFAQPGGQNIPMPWVNAATQAMANPPAGETANQAGTQSLITSLTAHITDVLTELKAAGVTPEFIQIGNEITDGILLQNNNNYPAAAVNVSYGGSTSNWPQLVQILNAGYKTVKTIDPNIKVVIHIDRAHDDSLDKGFYTSLQQNGGMWDVSGTDCDSGTMSDISYTMNDLATSFTQVYNPITNVPGQGGDGVMMCEIEPPGIFASNGTYAPNPNFDYVTDVFNLMRAVPNNKGVGAIYWEPEAEHDWDAGWPQSAWVNHEPSSALNSFLPSILQANGLNIVDGLGKPLQLKGVNLGGLMVMEPWMTPADASGLPDEYSIINELDTRFGVTEEQSLIQTYRQSWITSADFDNIKAQGLNVVRVPVWWGDFYTLSSLGTANPVMRSDAFTILDSIVATAAERGIYTIIDMHGVFGGQSTSDDTGYENQNQYWTNANDQANTQQMWSAIAAHYNGNAWVAGYDLLNEPSGAPNNAAVITALNSLYSTVRAADPNHMIFMEGTFGSTWGWGNLPNPSSEGWTNVVYEMHEYQWSNETVSGVEAGAANQVTDFNNHASYNVPAYIGEFNAFGTGTAAWQAVVNDFNNANMSWSSWSYKATHGAAPDSWGLYDPTGTWSTVPNITSDSSSTISTDWSKWTTSNTFALNSMVSGVLVGPASITSLPQATAGAGNPFTFQITATGAPTSYSATNLPAGLTLNSATGVISGTPTDPGDPSHTNVQTWVINLTVNYASGPSCTGALLLTIDPPGPTITSNLNVSATVGVPFTLYISTSTELGGLTEISSPGTELPPGLSITASDNGLISGTPTTAGTFTAELAASNQWGVNGPTVTMTFTVNPSTNPPVISSAATASATVGTAFSYTIAASNGPTSFNATGLPEGLAINTTTGVISGTPTTAGISTIDLSATNSGGTGTATLTLTVNPPAPEISSPTTASATVGTAFTYTITASNGPTSFNATGLPTGLSINTTTGVISGTPTGSGTSTVTLSATNADGTATETLALSVNTTTSVPTGWSSADIGSPALVGSALLTAPGSYTVVGGGADIWGTSDQFHFVDVPWMGDGVLVAQVLNLTNTNSAAKAGLMFRQSLANNASNVLVDITPSSGSEFNDRPTTGGSSSSTNTPGLTAPIWIKLVRTGTTFSAFSSADGVTWASVPLSGTTVTLTITDPIYAGLIVTSHNATTLATAQFANVTFLTTPSGLTGSATASQVALSWNANPNSTVTSEIAYDIERSPSGANTWTVLTSTLPVGTTSSTDSTIASGQSYDYRVRCLAANGQASGYDTITVLPAAPVISSAATATTTVGTAFSYTITATNVPTSFNATGLPSGLSVSTTTGVISGTPTTAGTSTVNLSATNSGGTGTSTLTLTVNPPAPVVSSPNTASATVGSSFSYTIAASNTPTSFAASGLPSGLSVSTSSGAITGTPTTAGSYPITISASNAGGTGTATLNLTVASPAPVITSSGSYTAINDSAFNFSIMASNTPTSFTASGLPSGLTLNTSTGVISGTPSQTGTFQVMVNATNAYGTGTQTLTLTINPPPTLTWTGTVSKNWDTTTSNWLNGSSASTYADPDHVQFTDSGSGGTITLTGTYRPSSATFSNVSQTYSMIGSGSLSGPMTLVKTGAGTINLSMANTFTGGTQLLAGEINISGANTVLGTGTLTFGSSGDASTVIVRANTINIANAISAYPGGTRWIEPGNGNAVTYTGPVTLNGGATLSMSTVGGNITLNGGITGTGNILFGENGGSRASSETLSGGVVNMAGSISDAGNPDKGGAFISASIGTNVTGITQNSTTESLTVTGKNPFNGPTTISSGTMTVGGTGVLGSGTFTGAIVDSGLLVYSSTATQTLAGAISGSGGLSASSAGLLVLSGADTYTGTTTVTAGTVMANSPSSSTFSVGSGGTLGGTGSIAGLTMTNGSGVIVNFPGSGVQGLTVNGNVALSGTITVNPTGATGALVPGTYPLVTYTGTLTGSPTFTWVTPPGSPNVVTFSTTSNPGEVAMIISPPPPVITSGLTATVAAQSPFAYNITATNSPTSYGVGGLPAGLSVNASSGAINGTATTAGLYPVTITASNASGTGTATLNLTVTPPAPAITSSSTYTATSNLPFSFNVMASNTPTSFTASGLPSGLTLNTSTGVISGTPTQTGTFQVTVNATNAYGTGTQTLTLTINPPPTLTWTGTVSKNWDTTTSNWLNGSSASTYADPDYVQFTDSGSGGTITLTGTYRPSSATFSNVSQTYSMIGSGSLSGPMTLVKTGAGTINLSMANTFTGGTQLLAGEINISGANTVLGTGTLTFGSSGDASTVIVRANTINIANAISAYPGGTRWIEPGNGNAVTYTGPVTLNGGATLSMSTVGGNITLNGGITGTGNILFGENGGSRASSETLSGGVVNMAGSISDAGNPDKGGAFISASIGTNVTGITQNSTSESMTLSGNNAFNGPVTITTGTLTLSGVGELGNGGYSGTISDSGALVYSSTADQTMSGVISGVGTLTDSGTGYLTLTGANTYTGATTVSSGAVLLVNQSLSSPVSVASGGLLGGSGTVYSNVAVASGGWVSFNVTGAGIAGLAINGNLSLTGTINVTPTIVSGSLTSGNYTIVTYTGTLSGTPTFVWTPPNGSSQTATFSTSTPGKITITVP